MLGKRFGLVATSVLVVALSFAACFDRPVPVPCENLCPADRSSHDYRWLVENYGIHPIGDQPYNPVNPQIDGDLVAFHHTVTGDQPLIRKTEIWVFNIAKHTLQAVGDEEGVFHRVPLVSDGRVVWTRNAGPDEWEIRMYDDATNTTSTVPIPVAGDPRGLALRGSTLIYSLATNLGPDYGIRMFDLETHKDSLLYKIKPDEQVFDRALTRDTLILGKNRQTPDGEVAEVSSVSLQTGEETVLASQPGYTLRRVAADNGRVAWESSATGRPTVWTLDHGAIKQVDRMGGFGGTEPNIVGQTLYFTERGDEGGGVFAHNLETQNSRAVISNQGQVHVVMQHDEDRQRGVAHISVEDRDLDFPGQRLFWFDLSTTAPS